MPRGPRRSHTDSPEARRLDEAARAFDRAQEALDKARAELQERTVAAVRAGMSKAEASRRSGYSREHVSKLANEASREPA